MTFLVLFVLTIGRAMPAGPAAAAPLRQPAADLHFVVERQFNYLSSVRTTTTDWWLAAGKRTSKAGDRLTIRREDLGVVWRVDTKAGTFVEEKIAAAPSTTTAVKEDIHTAGFDYEPQYDWDVRESSEQTTIGGRACREFIAKGDADYAEATVRFSLCDPIAGLSLPMNEIVAAPLFSASVRKMVAAAAAKANAWILRIEESQEPAIAPTMVVTVNVKGLEMSQAPPGMFELPAHAKKAGAK